MKNACLRKLGRFDIFPVDPSMPKYKKEYDRKIEPEEVQAMVNKAGHPSHRFLIAVLYLTGARPAEIIELKRRDFEIVANDLRVSLRTKKGGRPRSCRSI